MNSLRSKTQKLKIASVIVSVLFAVGVPLVIVGAVKLSSSAAWWVMLSCGIAFCGGGFYATPLLWVAYANSQKDLRIVECVEVSAIYDIKRLGNRFGEKPSAMVNHLINLTSKSYLSDEYDVNKEELRIERREYVRAECRDVCAYCGAVINDPSQKKCPDCGATVPH